jgi:hypothetical protein
MKLATAVGEFEYDNWHVKVPMLVVKSAKMPFVCAETLKVINASTTKLHHRQYPNLMFIRLSIGLLWSLPTTTG